MENKINIAELLKDCPRGTKLYSPLCGECTLYDVNDYNIRISTPNKDTLICLYHDGRYCSNGKIMLFPKGKTTWEGFVPPCKFKDGDVLVHTQNDRFIMSIYKSNKNEQLINTHAILWDREEGLSVGMQICCYTDNVRLATEEEKQKLFQAIKDNGYVWNEETKTLEKLPKFKVGDMIQDIGTYKVKITEVNIEDGCYEYESIIAKGISSIPFSEQDNWKLISNKFDISTLKPFEKVLVRDKDTDEWNCNLFSYYRKNSDRPYVCIGYDGMNEYEQCIPYGENKHLLGKTDDCDEYYKNW